MKTDCGTNGSFYSTSLFIPLLNAEGGPGQAAQHQPVPECGRGPSRPPGGHEDDDGDDDEDNHDQTSEHPERGGKHGLLRRLSHGEDWSLVM